MCLCSWTTASALVPTLFLILVAVLNSRTQFHESRLISRNLPKDLTRLTWSPASRNSCQQGLCPIGDHWVCTHEIPIHAPERPDSRTSQTPRTPWIRALAPGFAHPGYAQSHRTCALALRAENAPEFGHQELAHSPSGFGHRHALCSKSFAGTAAASLCKKRNASRPLQ